MSDVTRILSEIEQGDSSAAEQLLPLVYEELRRLAAQKMAQESPDHTLQATALVHEAYVRLVDPNRARGWKSRTHFFRAAAEAMRRILVESARRKKSIKGGGQLQRVPLNEPLVGNMVPVDEVLAVDEALKKFNSLEPEKAEVVRLRYFAGLSVQETADALGIARATADRRWRYAKTWLYCELNRGAGDTSQ